MAEFKTAAEFLSFERKWKLVFTVFALVFAGALLDHMELLAEDLSSGDLPD